MLEELDNQDKLGFLEQSGAKHPRFHVILQRMKAVRLVLLARLFVPLVSRLRN
jgi:hypothetical protein